MATRQQQQIESQHQILVAKEQRLRYLKHQEARTHQVAAENERLRRLKERVEAQELKLRKLRALRGQVDQDKISNGTLTSDLDTIRALFNEKEKELSLAVAKVEELTRQLEELKRNGRTKEAQPTATAALELDKLRRELLFRNKLKEQQNAQLNQQRDALTQRQEEINSIDKRITELQDRLQRKRLLNQQLANQLHFNNNNQTNVVKNNSDNNQNNINNVTSNGNNNNKQILMSSIRGSKSAIGLLSGYQGQRHNVAAVEPFIHVPNAYHHQRTGPDLIKQNSEDVPKNIVYQKQILKPPLTKDHHSEDVVNELVEYIPEFGASKLDPKYQTLPYNTKFGINQHKNIGHQSVGDVTTIENNNDGLYERNTGIVNPVGQQQQPQQQPPLMTVHNPHILPPNLNNINRIPNHLNPRIYGQQQQQPPPPPSQIKGQPMGTSPPVNNVSTSNSSGKPISSVAPTSIVQKLSPKNFLTSIDKPNPSSIYQTSSTKILPVQPQTLGGEQLISNHLMIAEGTESKNKKPALPPKPAVPIKPSPPPPPRLGHPPECPESKGFVEITAESLDQALGGKLPGVVLNCKMDEVPSNREPSRSPTPPPPPPPTSEPPPDDYNSTMMMDNFDLDVKDDKSVNVDNNISNQSSNLVNSNESGTTLINNYMPPAFMYPETEVNNVKDENDKYIMGKKFEETEEVVLKYSNDSPEVHNNIGNGCRRVSFDPLALLLDASLEGELELVIKTASQVANPSAANDEGITALHNAICAGHLEIVKFLVEFGCDVNAQDSDGWTPLHCAASCNNLAMVRFLVEHGACIFATTLSDHETAAEKCEEDEEGFDGCSEYLYSIQEKLGILNNGMVYAVYDYTAHNNDELSFSEGDRLIILRKGDEMEREWWWSRLQDKEGYTPRNLLGVKTTI
ncbi:apoptosis stimulating of P53, putative [Pediculus humanus corporis]|uniref:Apoptosis stimulating of P53, putative n=1 Tax=Pediculus humanus subsp. corporis TaxID=121224 RepID=E0VIP7_PEDHC|nr:apoptosis stimulating of P53, putative [Pediculus humanus corporis]EEB13253.1 apoptosis stimulating of P53, putative [Pediculus humanus corporis]